MDGEHILYHQARRVSQRVDWLMALYAYACVLFFVIAVVASVSLLWLDSVTTAISMFVLSTAVTGYAFSSLLARQQHIKDITDNTIGLLRSRWDELRKDQDLIRFFTTSTYGHDLDDAAKLKVRLYLSTVLDMYALIVHYINHGYFSDQARFAAIYEGMIKSLFLYPRMREVWESKDSWGKGSLREEYGVSLSHVVNNVIAEIDQENISE